MPLSNAEKCKNYRDRKKATKVKKIKKSNAEVCRMYRLRKKMLAQGYQPSLNTSSTSSKVQVTLGQSDFVSSTMSSVGEFRTAECKTEDGKKIVLIAVNITPNQKIEDIIHFLKQTLFPYTSIGGAYTGKGEDKLPMILSGVFNVNFKSQNAHILSQFLREDLNLSMDNESKLSITYNGAAIDAVFTRHLDNVSTTQFISFFTYSKAFETHITIKSEPD